MLMFNIPEVQCQQVNSLYGHITNTTFFDKPILLVSDTDAIRFSDTLQCILTLLMVHTTMVLYNFDTKWKLSVQLHDPSHILVHANIIKIQQYKMPQQEHWIWKTLNGRSKVLVVEESSQNTKWWLQTLFKSLFVVEVTVAVLEDGGSFYTWFPYRSPECNDYFNLVKLEPPQLFPRKIFTDLQGCFIAVVACASVPNVIDNEHGTEIEILRTITQKLNLTSIVTFADERTNPDQVDQLVGFARNRIFDVVIGSRGLLSYNYFRFEIVAPHSYTKCVMLYPVPKPINRMVLLVYAFPTELWICVIFNLFVITLACYLMKYKSSVMLAWAMALAQPYGSNKLNMQNMFVALSYLCCICLATIYQAGLFRLLQTVPRETPFFTIEELFQSQFTFLFYGESLVESEYPHPERIQRMEWHPMQEFEDESSYGVVLWPSYQYYAQINRSWFYDDSGHPKHVFLSDSVRFEAICFLLAPGHPLLALFSDITLRLLEGGLPDHWGKQFFKTTVYDDNINSPISLANVEGAFYVLLIMLFTALLTFSAEICVGYKTRVEQGKKFKPREMLRCWGRKVLKLVRKCRGRKRSVRK